MGPIIQLHISDLQPDDRERIDGVAQTLLEAFAHLPHWVSSLEEARQEIQESFGPGRISRVAQLDGKTVAWIGGIEQYDGHVWELHPLAVHPRFQRRGIGAALVRDFEECVRSRGGLTVSLGTDDETGGTSLFGRDLYPDVWEHVRRIQNLNSHPFEFYQKLGYVITGVVPDANGPGKPDIIMSRRVSALKNGQGA